jgi:hypothetical protein
MIFNATHDPIDCQLVLLPSPTNNLFLNTLPRAVLLYPLRLTENLRIYEGIRNRDITLSSMEGGEH